MSWGERSCKNSPCPIPDECTYVKCNVDCREYKWDNKTVPDSIKSQINLAEKKEIRCQHLKVMSNGICLKCGKLTKGKK